MKDIVNQNQLITPSVTARVAPGTVSQIKTGPVLGAEVGLRQNPSADGNVKPNEAQQKPDLQEVNNAVSHLNDYVQSVGRELQFRVDEQSGHTVITVIDAETKDTIRQIPPEQALSLAKQLDQDEKLDTTGFLVEA